MELFQGVPPICLVQSLVKHSHESPSGSRWHSAVALNLVHLHFHPATFHLQGNMYKVCNEVFHSTVTYKNCEIVICFHCQNYHLLIRKKVYCVVMVCSITQSSGTDLTNKAIVAIVQKFSVHINHRCQTHVMLDYTPTLMTR